jgi:preprotein translocase subunit YajC
MSATTSLVLFLILQNGGGGGGSIMFLLPWIAIFAIFYLLLIRPQQKRQRQAQMERDAMLKSLKPGDKVVTSGGIYATIVAVREKDDTVQLRIAQSVSIEAERSAVAKLQPSDKEPEPAK